VTPENKAKLLAINLGRHPSEETKAKISAALKGRTAPAQTLAALREANVGRQYSEEYRARLSIAHKGKTGPFSSHWKGGITPENRRIRDSDEYANWRIAVFVRDDFTCRICGNRGVHLEAHHMDGFADFPDRRLDVDNGITLCDAHHLELNRRYGTLHNRKWQTDEFLMGVCS